MSWQAFATDRSARGDRAVDRLHPLAATWLSNFGSDEALGDLVDAATDVWLDGFTAQAPQAYIDTAVGEFREMIGTYLAKTTEPEPDHAAQTRRVAVWLATVSTNDSAWQGFQASGGLRMRWVSRKDERVRNTHRAANGQIRSVLGAFDVGGAELRYPGDPRGPLSEVMECRCVLAPAGRIRTRRNGMTAAGDFDERPWALVALLPAEGDEVNAASSEDIAHVTFIWFGEPGEAFDADEIAFDLRIYAEATTPITVPVRERGVLGDDEADVLFLEPTESLMALRDGLMAHPEVQAAHDAVEQYPEWTPHVTLGYPETPALAEYDGDQITFDRFALWIGNDRMEFPMSGEAVTASAAIDIEVEDELTEIAEDVDMDDEDLVDEPLIEIPVHGVATIQGKPTGDGRMFAPGALSNRPLPLPLRYEFVGTHGGDTSMVAPVGRLDELWLHPTEEAGVEEYRYRGVIITTKQYANEALEGIADGSLTGVSVETDEVAIDTTEEREKFKQMLLADRQKMAEQEAAAEHAPDAAPEMSDEEIEALVDAFIGDGTTPLTVFSSARVCGFTIVPIPAFHEGYIALGPAFADELSEEDQEALVACGCYQPDDGDEASVIRGEDAFREVDTEERKRLAKEGNALPDGSFPIANVDDLKNAIQAIGRAKDPEAAKAHIKKRARALGHPELIPEDWSIGYESLHLQTLDQAEDAAIVEETEAMIASGGGILRIPDAFAPGTKDGPGWITHPRATARIRRYWVRGKGAAKIRWGAPGDFNRCRTQLAKYVQNPDWLAGLCANMHKEALGIWPGEHHSNRGLLASGERRPSTVDSFMRLVDPIEEDPGPMAIIASADWPDQFDAALFRNPNLDRPTPMTIEGDHIYGHIAAWNSCHIGMDGLCQNPPPSRSNYSWFRKGVIETTEGELVIGKLTCGTGHIGIRATAGQATAHYDKPQAVRAYIVTGEDVHGIWFSGVLKPGLTKAQIGELRALGAVSGDWRYVKGGMLELVGVTAVNVEGFQLENPRALVAAANGHQTALIPPPVLPQPEAVVASGTITVTPADLAAIARASAQEVLHQQQIAPRLERVREVRAQALAARVERVRAIREG